MHDDHGGSGEHGPSSSPWADRVNEAYFDTMGGDFGRRTRDRINWMCAQAKGSTVLDVGCSQGIASILMAREGMKVVGLDIYGPAIDYALTESRKEIESVIARLDFRCSELAAIGGEIFDTVVMGEVIEHQTNPGRFVEQGARLVAPNGRLVITVPFGLHPWPDHKSTIFPRQIYSAVANDFELTLLDVNSGYIRMVLDRREGKREQNTESEALLEATEKGALESQSRYYEVNGNVGALTKTSAELRVQLEKLRREFDQLTAQKQEESAAHKALSEQASRSLIEVESAKRSLAQNFEKLNVEATTRISALESAEQALVESHAARNKLEEQLGDLQRELTQQKSKCADFVIVSQRVQELEHTVQTLQGKLRSLESEYAIAQHKRSGHYLHLETERNRSRKLIPLMQELHRENQLYRQSIALDIGRAVLGLKTLRGMIGFPRAMARAWRAYGRRGGNDIVIEPLVLPRLDPVVLPSLDNSSNRGHLRDSSHAGAGATRSHALLSSASTDESRKQLSVSGWKQEIRQSTVPVVSVLDEFSRSCFAPHASLIEPRPDNWEALLEAYSPRLLLVESSWKGNYGTWQYRVANYANPPGRELPEMVEGFRARGIPTVFWNKEDPVHFNNFVEAASQFDIVLTTAAEAVPKYQEKTSARAEVLQFAAEESLHNPIGSARRNGKVCFAGSFYANRFHERRDDQLMLLDAASDFDFDIYDRNHDPKATTKSDFAFPERFSRFVRGSLPYDAMGRAYREYRVFLNVNSVIDSPTMFSRRVFELLACGTPVVSTWSRGTEETFGDNLVWHVRNKEEAAEAVRVLMTDDREWRRRSLAGIRAVLSRHTFRHRFRQILDIAGLQDDIEDPFERVLVAAEVSSQFEADAVVASFARQRVDGGTKKELLLVMRGGSQLSITRTDVRVMHDVSKSLAEMLVRASPSAGARLVARMSPLAAYGAHYLQDMLHAARYSRAAVVGKPADGREDSQYQYDIPLESRGLLVNEALLRDIGATLDDVFTGHAFTHVLRTAGNTYATDTANFLAIDAVMDADSQVLALAGIEL